MAKTIEVKVPDIGDFSDVPVIEVLVAEGDRVEAEQGLVTLESDKATMDVPSPQPGVVRSLKVGPGDRVSEGTPLLDLETVEESGGEAPGHDDAGSSEARESETESTGVAVDEEHAQEKGETKGRASEHEGGRGGARARPAPSTGPSDGDLHADVVVLGSGPGGYTAGFRAADLGAKTVLVERYPTLGGVCLNVGCIPSKALLHTAELIHGVEAMAAHGVVYGKPRIELGELSAWKDGVVGQLTKGLSGLARKRGVRVVQGTGAFGGANAITVRGADGEARVTFDHAIVAAGSQAAHIPAFPDDDPRVMDSTDALALEEIPDRLLVVGGGIIGLEMATVYHALGSRITVVELMDQLMPGADPEIVRPFAKHIGNQYEAIWLGTKVSGVEAGEHAMKVSFEGDAAPSSAEFDRILLAVGRTPNGNRIGAENAGVHVDDRGFVPSDRQQRTNVGHVFSIGDIKGHPMLAHKATHEGKVAAEVAAGLKSSFDALTVPSVAYTDPEVAWTGLGEAEAKEQGLEVEKATFPWAASGRSLGMGRNEGLTKVIFDKETGRLLGAAIVGPHAGDLIAEATLAIEMGADAQDIGLTIHPHPTLSETLNFAAEMVEGTITDLYVPGKKSEKEKK